MRFVLLFPESCSGTEDPSRLRHILFPNRKTLLNQRNDSWSKDRHFLVVCRGHCIQTQSCAKRHLVCSFTCMGKRHTRYLKNSAELRKMFSWPLPKISSYHWRRAFMVGGLGAVPAVNDGGQTAPVVYRHPRWTSLRV